MTTTRRKFLLRAGAVPAAALLYRPLRAADNGALVPSMAGAITQKKSGVFFNAGFGADTGQGVTILSSNVNAVSQSKTTTFANLAGAGPYAFFSFYMHALAEPINTAPLVVIKDPNIGDIFRIELFPAFETFSYFDTQRGTMQKTSVNVPRLNVFFKSVVGGAFVFTNYVTTLPKFAAGVDMMFRIFYNRQSRQPGEVPLTVLHDIKGQPSSLTVQQTRFGEFRNGRDTVPNGFVAPNWGFTGGYQPDFHVGGDPSTPYPNYAYHGVLGGLTAQLLPAPPDIFTTSGMVNQYGLFPRPQYGGIGLGLPGATPAVHLSGGPGYGGFENNQGISYRVDTLELDTTFGTPGGFSRPALIPEGTADFFSDE